MRRPYGSLVVETYISYHNQHPERGVVVRCKTKRSDRSRYFSVHRYGSLSTAIWHAVRWKNIAFRTTLLRKRAS